MSWRVGRNDAIDGTSLPTDPPDLELFDGGLSRIQRQMWGRRTGPTAFFSVEGTLDLLVRIVLGDMDGDGAVSGPDVDPCIDVLLASRFDVAADVNWDGVVNGLDVDAFIAALWRWGPRSLFVVRSHTILVAWSTGSATGIEKGVGDERSDPNPGNVSVHLVAWCCPESLGPCAGRRQ
jgi:hypothetical protein